MDNALDALSQSAPEIAKNTTASVHLEGWPAAIAFMSIPLSIAFCFAVHSYFAR